MSAIYLNAGETTASSGKLQSLGVAFLLCLEQSYASLLRAWQAVGLKRLFLLGRRQYRGAHSYNAVSLQVLSDDATWQQRVGGVFLNHGWLKMKSLQR